MKVLSEKRGELSQTVVSLLAPTRMEKGCRRCDFSRSVEDENRFFLFEEWDTRADLMVHLRSDHFKVLRGAMNLLEETFERTIYTDFNPKEMEEIS